MLTNTHRSERGPHGSELRELVRHGGVTITDVVDAASQRVEGRHRLTPIGREEAYAVREVLRLVSSDLLASVVGSGQIDHVDALNPVSPRERSGLPARRTIAARATAACEAFTSLLNTS